MRETHLALLAAGALLGYLELAARRDPQRALPGIVMACVLLLMLGRMPSDRASAKPKRSLGEVLRGFRSLLRNRTLVMICVSSIFRSMTQSSLMTFLPIFLATQLGYPPLWIGACMAGLQVAGFAATPIAGHLSDSMGRAV